MGKTKFISKIDKRVVKVYKVTFNYLIEDWIVLRNLIYWCDSYTRWGGLGVEILKNGINYNVTIHKDRNLMAYVKELIVCASWFTFKGEKNENHMKEFEEFILKKFKKASVKIEEIPVKIKKSRKRK